MKQQRKTKHGYLAKAKVASVVQTAPGNVHTAISSAFSKMYSGLQTQCPSMRPTELLIAITNHFLQSDDYKEIFTKLRPAIQDEIKQDLINNGTTELF